MRIFSDAEVRAGEKVAGDVVAAQRDTLDLEIDGDDGAVLHGDRLADVERGDGVGHPAAELDVGPFAVVGVTTDERELMRVAVETADTAKIAALMVPGIGTMDDMQKAMSGMVR